MFNDGTATKTLANKGRVARMLVVKMEVLFLRRGRLLQLYSFGHEAVPLHRLHHAAGRQDSHRIAPLVGYGAYGAKAHGDHEYLTTPALLQTAKVYAEIIVRLKD